MDDTTIASSQTTTTTQTETSSDGTTDTTTTGSGDTTSTADSSTGGESSTGEMLACSDAPSPSIGLLDDAWAVGPHGYPVAMTATASGEAIITGEQSDLDFDGLSIGSDISFVAKYGADLELAWAREVGNDYVVGVAVDDASGEITLAQQGAFTRLDGATGDVLWEVAAAAQVWGIAPLPGGDVVVTWFQGIDASIERLEADSGESVWQTQVVPAMGFNDFSIPRGVAVMDDGLVWIGNFAGTIATAAGDLASVPDRENVGVVRYDGDGNAQWAYAISSTGPIVEVEVGADPCGVYLSGRAIGPLEFGDAAPLPTNQSLFLVRVDLDGVLQWGRDYGYDLSTAGAMDVDDEGNVLLTGDGNGGNFGAFDLPYSEQRQAYLAKIGNDGEPLWAHRFAGTWNVFGGAAAFDGDGNAWVAGRFDAPGADVGGEVLGAGGFETPMYVARFQP